MYDIRISQNTYDLATSAAQAEHIPLDQFVEEAVQMRLQDQWLEPESFRLTPEQLDKVREAQVSLAAGKGSSIEQVRDDLAKMKAEWLAKNSG